HHHLHADHHGPDTSDRHQPGPYGCGDRADPGFRPDHAPLRDRAIDGVEIRQCPFLASDARLAADLYRVPLDDNVLHLRPEGGVVAAEAVSATIGGLLPEPERA